ncbi:phage tail length tape measure family protein [Oxalobacteraceae bacterium A2-2]
MQRVETAFTQGTRTITSLGTAGTAALDGIAASSSTAAARVDNATRSLASSVERATAALESGKKSSADYFEALAIRRGANMDVLAPYIAQLREVEVAQQRAAQAAEQTRAAQQAAAETARTEAAAQREAAQALAGRESFLAGLREQIALYGRSSEEVLRYRAAVAGVSAQADPLIDQLQSLRAAHEQVTAAARASAEAERQATQVQAGRDQFVQGLQEQAEAIGRTRAELLELRAAQLGVSTQAAPFIARIREAEQGLNRTGVSAAQTAAALRGVPAQFTDIVTSLQGGQAPLTVFLQQGGQLRDMFGGAGAAARALGGYIVGLVNPFTVAAAAAAALALAYKQGSAEADEYRRALVMTGNAAGTTTAQLAGMAQAISKQVGTQGDAATALAELAATGQVGADNLQQFGATAVRAQESLQAAISDTVKDFAELGKSPLQTSEKLNEKYHYLTLAVYEQIKALEQQGRSEEAATVAQQAYSDMLNSRSGTMKENLGTLEKAWKGVADFAKDAWDKMLDVGREDSFDKQLAKAEAALEKAKRARFTFAGGGADGKADLDNAQAEVDRLKARADAEKRLAGIQADKVKLQEAGAAWDKEGDKYLTRREQLERDIIASRNKGLAAGVSDAEIAKREVEIRKQYADIFNAGIDSQLEAIKRRGTVEDEVANRSRTLLESNKAAGLVTEEDYLRAVEQLDQVAFTKQKDRLQQELRLTAGKQNSEKDLAALRGQIADTDEKILSRKLKLQQDLDTLDTNNTRKAANGYADLVDKQDAVVRSLQQQVQAQRDANDQIGLNATGVAELTATRLEELAVDRDLAAITADGIDLSGRLGDKYREEAKALRDLATAKREGAVKEVAVSAAKDAADAAKKMADDIQSSLTDALMRGFENGKSFAENLRDTTIAMFKTMVLQPTIQGVVSGGFSGITGTGASTNSATAALQAASGLGGLYNTFAGLGGTVSTLGNVFGSSAVAAFGAGLSGGAGVTEAIAAYNAAGLTSVGSAMSAGASVSTGISTAIAAIPGWGWAALGAAAIGAYLLNDGPEQNTRLTFTSNNTPGAISINERGNEGKNSDKYIAGSGTSAFGSFGVSSTFWAPAESETIQSFIKTVSQTDDALASFLTTAEKASVSSYLTGKNYTANTGAEGNIGASGEELSKVFAQRINNILEGIEPGLASLESGFTGTSQELASEVAALLQYRAALKDSGEAVFGTTVTLQQIAALKTPTEATSEALARITNEFAATNQVAALLGKDTATAFGAAGLASEAARAQIMLLSGGLSTFTSQASSYAQNYLTEAERLAPVSKALDAALASMNLTTIPQTRDEFKALVSSLDLSSEGGQKTYAALMSVQEAFAQVHPAAEAVATTVKSAADIASEAADLQKRLNEATLTTAQLQDLERAGLAEVNRTLYDSVIAAEAAKAATEAKAQADQAAAEALASTNASYQQQIDQLLAARQGEAGVRALETAGMADSTIALYDRLAALKAEDAAASAAAQAAQSLASANSGYQQQIDQLLAAREGEAAVRALETRGMADSTVALYDRLKALQAEDAAAAAAASAQQQAAQALASANASYQQQIDQLLAARAGEAAVRELEIRGMGASTVALYDRLAALKAEDAALAASAAAEQKLRDAGVANAQAAQQAAAQAAQQLASDMASKELELYNLTHTAAEQLAHSRELELAAMGAALRPIQQQINAQKDLASAATAAAAEIEAAAQKAQAVATERAGIQSAIWQLTGDTAAIRAAELAGLDASNRDLKQQYYDMQDKLAADQRAAQMAQQMADAQQKAADESKRAAEALKSAWQSATDSVMDEVKRIRGLITGNSPESLADAQGAFAIATAKARAGDQEAAKTLPALSQAMLTLAEAQAVTEADIRLARAQAAASLTMTAGLLADQYALTVPSYDVGTDYVPGTGLALIHQGEKIIPAAYNNPFTPPASSDSDSAAEIRALRAVVVELKAELAEFRRENGNGLYSIAKSSMTTAQGVDAAISGQAPFAVKVVTA